MRRLWVTGATGYLGRELVPRAADAGWEVETARVDVRDSAAVAAFAEAGRPAAVVHAAYVQGGPDAWSVTVDGAELGAAGPLHVPVADAVSRCEFARLVLAANGRDPEEIRGEPPRCRARSTDPRLVPRAVDDSHARARCT